MNWLINSEAAWGAAALVACVGSACAHVWLYKRYKTGLHPLFYASLLLVLALSWWATEDAGRREAGNLRRMLQGLAPTYAHEMQAMGHPSLSLDAAADDPLYLSLINRQIQWLKINTFVNDIYTFRKRPDGKIVLMVDSETDYDHNGKYEGDREKRTPIGEEYDADENLRAAFEGKPVFDASPYTDRWGTWVSAYAPIFREDGTVDAVLGVDYDARNWVLSIARRKTSVIVPFFLLTMAMLVSACIIAFIKAETAERQSLEAHLVQAQKMETVGTLAGGIAHDLNNQLTPLVGYIDILLRQADPQSPDRPMLDEASRSAARCADIVHRLLSFSKPSTHKKEIVSVAAILQEFKSLFDKVAPSTIRLIVECPPDLWPVEGNASDLHTVLMNLAVNARDAMPSGGTLAIRASNSNAHDREILIEVADTGVGMDPQVLPRIFEPFFTTKGRDRGTGLGLAMVFNIIKNHKGKISASSDRGEGSVFFIQLPAATKKEMRSSEKNAQAVFLPKGTETVLFVDDEESLRVMGKAFLDRLGYRAILARDGQEALDIYKKEGGRIDVSVIDITMPRMTGLAVLKEIVAINPRAKVILCSGYTIEGSAEELMRAGAKLFIPKPYTIQTLAMGLRQVIESSKI